MTPEELAEIDRKVAEAIGGETGSDDWNWKFPWGGVANKSTQNTHHPDGLYEEEQYNVWRPSTDWNDAMFAAEKAFGEQSYSVSYDHEYGIDKRTGWNVSVGQTSLNQFAETGPMAVCLAILNLTGPSE